MASEDGDGEESGGLAGMPGGRGVRLFALSVLVLAVLVVGLSLADSTATCRTVSHVPSVSFDAEYGNGTLLLTHAGGESVDSDWANRTTVRVRTDDGRRAGYPLPADGPYPLEHDDTVRIDDVTVDGDPLGAGAEITVSYDTRVEYPWYCVDRSETKSHFEGRLAENGTVV